MGEVDFLGEYPLDLARRLERLTADIHRLAIGRLPDMAVLGGAPFLADWTLAIRPSLALAGTLIDDSAPRAERITSDLYAISTDGRWARTLNRWYLLDGRTAGN